MMLLIEHDKRGSDFAVRLTYSEESFSVPDNVHIIGLMNTADRSLAMVDYALRRRFVFFTLEPRFHSPGFAELLRMRGAEDSLIQRIVSRMDALNARIAEDARNLGPGFCLGHSFFCPADSDVLDDNWYATVVRNEIAPLLREYWFDAPGTAEGLIDQLNEL
jgi:hypothetical protein